jgi:hypothetical protein
VFDVQKIDGGRLFASKDKFSQTQSQCNRVEVHRAEMV